MDSAYGTERLIVKREKIGYNGSMRAQTETIHFCYGDIDVERTVTKTAGGGPWIFKLERDYSRRHPSLAGITFKADWLSITGDGTVTIPAGYAWDGNSKKINILDLWIIGTPDGRIDIETGKPKTWFASLVHDALYQYYGYHGIERKEMDDIYRRIAAESRFLLTPLYWFCIRLLGGLFFVRKKKTIRRFPDRTIVLYTSFYNPEGYNGNTGN